VNVGRRIAIVGGGVGGLTTAYRLVELDPTLDVAVFEADLRPGGKVRSTRVGDLNLPAGADSFLARKPWAADLCRELGLAPELVAPASTGTYLWTDGGLVRFPKHAAFGIPGDVGDVWRWPGLSRAGRRRALLDLVKAKRRGDQDETLGSLLRRRLGNEATDLAVAPLLAGLFAGDVDRLSVAATFPELRDWEREQGSLIRGSQAAARRMAQAAPSPMFLSPRGGVERLVEVLAERVGPRLRTGAPVRAIERAGAGWRVLAGADEFEADNVVLATPAGVAADLIRPHAQAASADLDAIPAVSTGVVLLVYASGTRAALLDGTGFVVPHGKAPMTACTWLSSKWTREEHGTRAVVRCYVGGAGAEDVLDAPDRDLIEACARHLAAVVSLPEAPEHAGVVRWPGSMPQYELGHLERVERIRQQLPPGIFVTGQPYDGAGIPDCVRAATATASAVAARAAGAPTAEETVR
jgi:protoporphyrinogen/coproporphyrinogen III oxidase